MGYYIVNIVALIIVVYRISIGAKGGLFSECSNLINFLFSMGISFTLFNSVGSCIYKYVYPNKDYALLIAFWLVFALVFLWMWMIKVHLFARVYSFTGKETIPFPSFLDRVGGAVCGMLLGLILLSTIAMSLYLAPCSERTYSNMQKDGKMIFSIDEIWPRSYSTFTRFVPSGDEFDWEEFLNEYKLAKVEEGDVSDTSLEEEDGGDTSLEDGS